MGLARLVEGAVDPKNEVSRQRRDWRIRRCVKDEARVIRTLEILGNSLANRKRD